MSLIRQFALPNDLLYSGFVLPNVQIFFVPKISFATFGVTIDDFFYEIRWSGLQPINRINKKKLQNIVNFSVLNFYLNLFNEFNNTSAIVSELSSHL